MRKLTEKTFGGRLKAARRTAGLTQQQAAERAGFGQPTWADYESGRHSPGLAMAAKLAAAVGVPLADLLG